MVWERAGFLLGPVNLLREAGDRRRDSQIVLGVNALGPRWELNTQRHGAGWGACMPLHQGTMTWQC